MKLDTQIISILFCMAYGIFFALCFNLFYTYLFFSNKYIKIINNIIFMLIMFFIFTISNTLINSGVIHIYFLAIFIFSFFLGNKIFKKIRCKL